MAVDSGERGGIVPWLVLSHPFFKLVIAVLRGFFLRVLFYYLKIIFIFQI